MNRNDFLRLMENSSSIDPKMTTEVGEIISIFPYFQSAHLLLLKGLHDNGDVRFGNQLRSSAIHLADREILYHLLYSSDNKPEIASAPVSNTPATEQTVIESGLSSNDIVYSDQSSGEPDPGEDDEEITDILADDDFEDPENDYPAGELLELDLERNGNNDTSHFPFEEVVSQEPAKLSQSDLIDRFIISNPRIEPNREKKEVPTQDLSEPSSGEGSLITETLAKIYISQGYYSKAIDIFEKLCLKYPEKSSYFATQIEKVKEYLKK